MTRRYETVYIFDSALEEPAINEKLERFHALITRGGTGALTNVAHWGKRTLAYPVKRAWGVVAKGFNTYGDPVTIEGTELLARCIQHETDHLDGILFIDRMDSAQRKAAMKAIREAEWWGDPVPRVRVSPHDTRGQAT